MSNRKTAFRDRLAEDVTERYEQVRDALSAAMSAEKRAWAFCPDCRRKVQVDYPDHSARIRAIELWLEQGFGRAAASQSADAALASADELHSLDDAALHALAWRGLSASEREQLLEGLAALELPPEVLVAAEVLERSAAAVLA